MIQASDGNFYGTTRSGGQFDVGTAFTINPNGSGFNLLHSFVCDGDDGCNPGGLIQASDGRLYGITSQGGVFGHGTVYRITLTGPVVDIIAIPATVSLGGTVTATWSGIASPTSTDWIGLYLPGTAETAFIDWIYVSCSNSAGAARAQGSCPFALPGKLLPGTYELRLFTNDGFIRLATSNNFTVKSAATLTASPSFVPIGGTLMATWSGIASPSSTDWIGIYKHGADNTAYLGWIYVSCSQTPGSPKASGSCSFTMPGSLSPGDYELRLLANDGFAVLATSSGFNISGALLTASPSSIPAGGTVTATWSGLSSADSKDWIGIYQPGASNTAYLGWIYTSCSQTPGTARLSGSCPFTVPGSLSPGTYELRLLWSDGFTTLATSNNFTVTGVTAQGVRR